MNATCSKPPAAPGRLIATLVATLLLLAACGGTAVVTMTSTASPDPFLAYRVGLVSVQLQTLGGKAGLTVLPASTSVDLTTLVDLSEVLGAAAVAKGNYTGAIVTLDYSAAQIVYDDGSLNGLALTPVGTNGRALGLVRLGVTLDPSQQFSITAGRTVRLALDFKLAASNAVNLAKQTVTVTPMIVASDMPVDTKPVRIRGPLVSVNAANSSNPMFTTGIMPFDGAVNGAGQLRITSSDATTYEINGFPSIGNVGLARLAAVNSGALTVTYGTLSSTDTTTSTTTALDGTTGTAADGTTLDGTPTDDAASSTSVTDLTFTATQVLAGSSVQGLGFDRLTGIVAARSGATLAIVDGTLVGADGTAAFMPGSTLVNIGGNTVVTFFGQSITEVISPQQISVGSAIDAFGTATTLTSGAVTLDASVGRVRLSPSTAAGLVTAQGSGALSLNLKYLGGRLAGIFDFVGSGASAAQYTVNTGTLDLTNATVGSPVVVSGFPNLFGATPNFTASTLLDPTTIPAELVVDFGSGTAAPFVTYDDTAIDLNIHSSGIGPRHQIQVGAQTIDVTGLSSDPLIEPSPTAAASVFAIGHAASSTVESFNTYAAFIAQLQTELNGVVLVTGVTALGQYTTTSYTFAATSITVFLNN